MSGSESPRVSPYISHDPDDISGTGDLTFEGPLRQRDPRLPWKSDVVEYVSRAPCCLHSASGGGGRFIQPLLSGRWRRPNHSDLSAATAAWRQTNGGHDFVTLAGELLNRHGVYTGGQRSGNGAGKSGASVLDERTRFQN
jgi:hypothetical protein